MPAPAAVASAPKRAIAEMPGCELLTQPATNAEPRMKVSSVHVVPPNRSPTNAPSRIASVAASIVPARPRRVTPLSHIVTNIAVAPPATAACRCPASAKPKSGSPTAIATRMNNATEIARESISNKARYQRDIMRRRSRSRITALGKL
jgi:hypothetical protein